MNTTQQLSEQEKTELIARACGWTVDAHGWWSHPTLPDNGGAEVDPPSYFHSLDAMHEAEKVLDMHQAYTYGEELKKIAFSGEMEFEREIGDRKPDDDDFMPNGWGWHAVATLTADQKAHAFGIACGLWT